MSRFVVLYGGILTLWLLMMGVLVTMSGCATEVVHPRAMNPSVKYRCHEVSGETTMCEKYYDPKEH